MSVYFGLSLGPVRVQDFPLSYCGVCILRYQLLNVVPYIYYYIDIPMNWTGGRLRRHASNNKNATLTKVQKQRFAKARAKTSKKDIYRDVPFQDFTQFKHLHRDSTSQVQEACRVDKETVAATQRGRNMMTILKLSPTLLTTTKSGSTLANRPGSSLPHSQHPHLERPTRLDRIKRQLLDKTDWAAVSVSRPLQMTFTPPEELEQFGKRRRLTEEDRKRLGNYGRRVQAPESAIAHQRRRDDSPSEISIADMNIKINGANPGAQPASADEGTTFINTSSQPMLLDHESTQEPRTRHEEGLLETWLNQLSSTSARPSSSDGYLSPSRPKSTDLPISNMIARYSTRRSCDITSPKQQDSIETLSASNHSNPTSQLGSPAKRQFTLDSQVLAQQEGLLNIHTTIPETQHISENSNSARLFFLSRSPITQFTSSGHPSPWLPRPKCSIQRFNEREPRGFSSFITKSYSNHDKFQTDLRPDNTENRFASPMTIYGQSIAFGGNGSIEKSDESPRTIWRKI